MAGEWKPCCGSCYAERIEFDGEHHVCRACGIQWDGSEVNADIITARAISEDDGVAMCIYLQKLDGVAEPPERARAEWRKFTAREKAWTKKVYEHMKAHEHGQPVPN